MKRSGFPGCEKTDFVTQIGKYIVWIEEDTVSAYIDAVLAQRLRESGQKNPELSIVYTPLNGTGKECVLRCLEKAGYSDITLVPEQSEPDGNSPLVPILIRKRTAPCV